MHRVDKLLNKASSTYGNAGKEVSMAFIDPVFDGDEIVRWEARADLWDGKPASVKDEDRPTSYHDTLEEAQQHIEELIERFKPKGKRPKFDPITVIIDYPEIGMTTNKMSF